MGRGHVAWGAALTLTLCGSAHAYPVAANSTAANGEGHFVDAPACAAGGAGPAWRFGYSGGTSGGPLAGVWTGTVEVHDAGTEAYIAPGDGRLALRSNRGGTAHLEFGRGGCDDATLALQGGAVSGTLPVVATGGDGTLRGLAGSGAATFRFGLGPGAANPASVALSGNFTVTPPAQGVGGAVPFYKNAADFLTRKLTVRVLLTDAAGAGDAYAVRLTAARLAANPAATGVPSAPVRIDAGRSRWVTVTFANAAPNRSYALTTTVAATDSIDAPMAAVTQTRTIRTPGSF